MTFSKSRIPVNNMDNKDLADSKPPILVDEPNEMSQDHNLTCLVVNKLDNFQDYLNILHTEFQGKLKYDQHKEKIIDNLHNELQEHKNDLLKRLLQPMMMDVIQTIDDVNKLIHHYRQKEAAKIEPQKLLELMESIPDDLEHLLYRQGVESFQCLEPVFNPIRQRAIKTVPTSDQAKDKMIIQSLRNGYEWEGKILRPEMVEVYVYSDSKAEASN